MDWVRNPFIDSAYETALFTTDEESELIDIKNDRGLKIQYSKLVEDVARESKLKKIKINVDVSSFYINLLHEYPKILRKAMNAILPFSTSYICEAAFSSMNAIKTKNRSQLKNLEDDMRVEVVEGDEFLSLSFEQMVKLIFCDEVKVPPEEKVDELVTIPYHIWTKPRQPSGSHKIGGVDGLSKQRLNSVECYHPFLDKWIPVTKMRVRRSTVGVGVLDDVMYAVGGTNGLKVHRSVEAYSLSTGVWTSIPDMHLCRQFPGVAVLDGLLYVIGGDDRTSTFDSVEFYNPNSNTWTMVTTSSNNAQTAAGVVTIDRPHNFKTC
ncbi:hypothetical protein QTP88_001769 [Uroleucon formosanum]